MNISPENPASSRLPMVDALRGIALVAMIIFHASWNLDVFGFAQFGVMSATGWIWFARVIAGSFLVLAGLSLILADAAGHSLKKKLLRIAKITAAAVLVSIATYIVFPETFVYFGILHHLALASLLALPLLQTHWVVNVAIAIAVVFAHLMLSTEIADTRWLAWIGISSTVPPTNDYVPLVPWIAVFLCGIPAGRQILKRNWLNQLFAAKPIWAKPLIWMGNRSLIIYLLHQPILFGIAYGIFTLTQ